MTADRPVSLGGHLPGAPPLSDAQARELLRELKNRPGEVTPGGEIGNGVGDFGALLRDLHPGDVAAFAGEWSYLHHRDGRLLDAREVSALRVWSAGVVRAAVARETA